MNANHPDSDATGDLRAAIANLAHRLEVVEAKLGLQETAVPVVPIVRELQEESPPVTAPQRESLEFELGQNWFALIGIVVLAIGLAFLLSLPYPSLPAWLPSLGGYLLCAAVLVLARVVRKSFEAIAKYMRGAGMLLLFFATLRLFYFGSPSALEPATLVGEGLFLLALALNLFSC